MRRVYLRMGRMGRLRRMGPTERMGHFTLYHLFMCAATSCTYFLTTSPTLHVCGFSAECVQQPSVRATAASKACPHLAVVTWLSV